MVRAKIDRGDRSRGEDCDDGFILEKRDQGMTLWSAGRGQDPRTSWLKITPGSQSLRVYIAYTSEGSGRERWGMTGHGGVTLGSK